MERPLAKARPLGPFIGKDPEEKAVYDTLTGLGLSSSRDDLQLDLDATFGSTVNWWRRRCLFKKTQSNAQGQFGIPVREAEALMLNERDRMNFLVINLNTQEYTQIYNKNLVPVRPEDGENYFNFTVSEDEISRITGRNLEDAPPLQFVGAPIKNPDKIVSGNVREPEGNTRFIASNLALYKDIIRKDDIERDRDLRDLYVAIERNEMRYFGMSPGDDVRISIIPIAEYDPYIPITEFTQGKSYKTEIMSVDSTPRIYLGNLIDEISGLKEGRMLQCIVNPNP